jgi:hypothetical protein
MEEQFQLDHSLDEYVQKMISYGITMNEKLQPALFYLKNGLKYPGLLTKEAVSGVEELMKIPIALILTAHKALKEPALEELFTNTFYREGPLWQDRVLITYLLYILSKNADSIWAHMAKQFSKDIDIISFWD